MPPPRYTETVDNLHYCKLFELSNKPVLKVTQSTELSVDISPLQTHAVFRRHVALSYLRW